MRIALAVSVIVALLVASIAGSYALADHALAVSQRHWCQTLRLLTARTIPRPANPRANPSREDTYLFWLHLVQLERDFGC